MKIIYSCYWGSYLAVVAALIHLGRIVHLGDIEECCIDIYGEQEMGELFLLGEDDKGRKIYVVGSKNAGGVLEKTLYGISEIFGLGKHTLYFIDLNEHNSYFVILGGWLIKRYNIKKLGMKLVTFGIRTRFERLYDITNEVKRELDRTKI